MNFQRSLTDQLRKLYALANRNGLYDAADFLKAHLEQGDAMVDCEALDAAYWQDYERPVNELPNDTIIVAELEEP